MSLPSKGTPCSPDNRWSKGRCNRVTTRTTKFLGLKEPVGKKCPPNCSWKSTRGQLQADRSWHFSQPLSPTCLPSALLPCSGCPPGCLCALPPVHNSCRLYYALHTTAWTLVSSPPASTHSSIFLGANCACWDALATLTAFCWRVIPFGKGNLTGRTPLQLSPSPRLQQCTEITLRKIILYIHVWLTFTFWFLCSLHLSPQITPTFYLSSV